MAKESRVCKCQHPERVWLVDAQKWLCTVCHKPPRRIASTFLHLPPVSGASKVRSSKAHAPPSTLCGEHTKQRVAADASQVSCERCMAIIKKRPQLANYIRANAEEPTA
jgi:hypothetical protein